MAPADCCPAARGHPAKCHWLRTAGSVLLPGGLLLLMPKCPLCLAGYVAAISGLGLSFATASYLRTGLMILCAAWLCFLFSRALLRHVRRNVQSGPSS